MIQHEDDRSTVSANREVDTTGVPFPSLTVGQTVTKRAMEDMMAMQTRLAAYDEAERKRKKRKQKATDKGEDFKKIDGIPKDACLDDSAQERLGTMVREDTWPGMKYYTPYRKNEVLEMAYEALGMNNRIDKHKYDDFIIWFVDNRLTTHTHNCIGYLKKKVMNGGGTEGKVLVL